MSEPFDWAKYLVGYIETLRDISNTIEQRKTTAPMFRQFHRGKVRAYNDVLTHIHREILKDVTEGNDTSVGESE